VKVSRCHLRANLGSVVAGDRVIFCAGEETGVIVAREERDTALRRPDKFGKLRTVAANIDRVVIVIAPLPEPHANLIDRYLVAIENLGAEAVILLNKADLLGDPAVAAALQKILEPYPSLGYPVIEAEGKSGAVAELTALLRDHTSILVGQSGVGKTTLVNAILPDVDEAVGALSPDRQKGRHTTTTARLFDLPDGGSLIDSPGIREFGLWHMSRAEVEHGFREFSARIGHCRFRDCRHQSEPGCALTVASERGAIHPARLASFRHIIASLDQELQG
jgi:ribosome biogenesis GTPase